MSSEHPTSTSSGLGTLLTPGLAYEAIERFNDILILAAEDPTYDEGIRIIYVNPAFERITGYPSAEAIGRSPRFLGGPGTSGEELSRVDLAIRERRPLRAELLNYRRDGHPFWVELELSHMIHPESGAHLYLFIERDVSEHKRLVAQVIQGQRLESIGTLAGGVAHDLNNIIAPLLMACDILPEKVSDDEGRELVKLIQGNSHRAASLVRQVLMFARGIEGVRVPLPAERLIKEMQTFLSGALPRHITLSTRVQEGMRPIHGDPAQLHQLLLNLCVNARDAMPKGGTLSLSCTPFSVSPSPPRPHPDAVPGDFVRIDISDTGIGIPDSIKTQVFDPFFTTKGASRGSGLGLSTARSIVKAHAGFISFTSQEGKGTTFSVFLPCVEPGQEQKAPGGTDRSDEPLPGGDGRRVLVLDDEASLCEILKVTLEHHGFRVFTASTAEVAVAELVHQSETYSVALIDANLPGLDGPAAVAVIRQLEPSIAFVATGGYSAPGMRERLLETGVRHFLDKPFTVDTLVRCVHAAIGPSGK
jgi:two-component system, cell cycle sensor histidine kinase and response regulator CckA